MTLPLWSISHCQSSHFASAPGGECERQSAAVKWRMKLNTLIATGGVCSDAGDVRAGSSNQPTRCRPEAWKLAVLHDRNDLVENKDIDVAVSYADGLMSDIDIMQICFDVEAVRIRNEAIAEASGLEPGDAFVKKHPSAI